MRTATLCALIFLLAVPSLAIRHKVNKAHLAAPGGNGNGNGNGQNNGNGGNGNGNNNGPKPLPDGSYMIAHVHEDLILGYHLAVAAEEFSWDVRRDNEGHHHISIGPKFITISTDGVSFTDDNGSGSAFKIERAEDGHALCVKHVASGQFLNVNEEGEAVPAEHCGEHGDWNFLGEVHEVKKGAYLFASWKGSAHHYLSADNNEAGISGDLPDFREDVWETVPLPNNQVGLKNLHVTSFFSPDAEGPHMTLAPSADSAVNFITLPDNAGVCIQLAASGKFLIADIVDDEPILGTSDVCDGDNIAHAWHVFRLN